MKDRPEFTGMSADPRQHLIDLGVDGDFVDMVKTILHDAQSPRDIGKVIRRGQFNTALGGQQLTSPLVRRLYTDDPLVREEFRERLKQYQLPDQVLDTYFEAQQYGYTDVLLRHRDVVAQVDKERMAEFDRAAEEVAFGFLRSYFGFISKSLS